MERPRQLFWEKSVKLRALLEQMTKMMAADMHIAVGIPPVFRVHGQLVPSQGSPLDVIGVRTLLAPFVSSDALAIIRTGGTAGLLLGEEDSKFKGFLFCDPHGDWAASIGRSRKMVTSPKQTIK
jgi:hypothetical protein